MSRALWLAFCVYAHVHGQLRFEGAVKLRELRIWHEHTHVAVIVHKKAPAINIKQVIFKLGIKCYRFTALAYFVNENVRSESFQMMQKIQIALFSFRHQPKLFH